MFTIKFDTSNTTFSGDVTGEMARVLRRMAYQIESTWDDHGLVQDVNGNTIGYWSHSAPVAEDAETEM